MNEPSRVFFILAAVGIATLMAGCERPPMESEQLGYRGTGIVEINNPRLTEATLRRNLAPAPAPAVTPIGQPAAVVFQNVQVLGNLDVSQFTRLMQAMTEWVSPEQGCNYCHEGNDLASDALYTKVFSRRMLQMTQHINGQWQDHVGNTGVTCYTCHRGQPVPAYVWFTDPARRQAGGAAADRNGQNLASASVGDTSLPYDPFTPFLSQAQEIRVVGNTALPTGNAQTIKQAEGAYGLMMHFSHSLGVNCTYCHNSRSFFAWDQSSPQRVTAWHGIQMARDLNNNYLEPLAPQLPPHRLGPRGDVPKINCSTCHQGVNKPLNGASMLQDYPSLSGAAGQSQSASAAQ